MQSIQYPVNLEWLTTVWQQYSPRSDGNLPRLSAELLQSLLSHHVKRIVEGLG